MSPPVPAWLSASLRGALALVSPCDCAGCGRGDVELCDVCRAHLAPEIVEGVLPDGTPLCAALVYRGVVRDVVLAFKQEGRFRLARPLGPAMRLALDRWPDAVALPVPGSARGRRRRGYEPVELLVRRAGLPVCRPGLRFVPLRILGGAGAVGGAQKGRSRAARIEARHGSMRGSPRLAGRRVVVVDDVMTTGATLAEAVRAARDAGAEVVGACCLAAVPLASSTAEAPDTPLISQRRA